MAKTSKRLLRVKIYRYSIFFILILIAASIAVSFFESSLNSKIEGKPKLAESMIKNFRYKKIKNGKLLYTIDAPTVKIENNRYIMSHPIVIYFSKRQYRMKSEKAVYSKNGNIEATGKIKITTSDGYILTTQYLRYNPKTRTIYAPKKLVLKGNKIEGKGQNATLNIKNGVLIIHKDVTIKLKETK